MKRGWKLVRSYGVDWAITVASILIFYNLDRIQGHQRPFSATDKTIAFKYIEHETISVWMLAVLTIAIPLIGAWVVNLFTIRSWWDAHVSALGLFLSLSLSGAFTQIANLTAGRPRPDFLDRCQLPPGTVDPPYGLLEPSICTRKDLIKDGYRSFFSGHTSFAFAGLGFLSFYIAGKLHLFDRKGHTAKSWLAVAPLAGAFWVAVSRTMDNRHHYEDVIAASVTGLAFAFFSYHQYYPILNSDDSHLPFESRVPHKKPQDTLPIYDQRAVGKQPSFDPRESRVPLLHQDSAYEPPSGIPQELRRRPDFGSSHTTLPSSTIPVTPLTAASDRSQPSVPQFYPSYPQPQPQRFSRDTIEMERFENEQSRGGSAPRT